MELKDRVTQLGDEIKILKNEVQAVLLDIRESYLNRENPFNPDISPMSSPPIMISQPPPMSIPPVIINQSPPMSSPPVIINQSPPMEEEPHGMIPGENRENELLGAGGLTNEQEPVYKQEPV